MGFEKCPLCGGELVEILVETTGGWSTKLKCTKCGYTVLKGYMYFS